MWETGKEGGVVNISNCMFKSQLEIITTVLRKFSRNTVLIALHFTILRAPNKEYQKYRNSFSKI